MKSRTEARLECLRMANSLACGKNIKPDDVVGYAMAFYRWIDDDPNDKADVSVLEKKFRRV